MHKRLIWLVAIGLLVGVLASCQSKAPETVVSQPTPEPPTATPVATATPVPATATAEPVATTAPNTPTATAAPAGQRASPTPIPPWQIPTVHSGDWAKGNPEAGLVIVEYSDFQ
jgi:hypothetical protein